MTSEERPRIGVFVCHCGHNIAGTVDVERVAKSASLLPNVEYSTHYMFMCSDSGQALIRERIEQDNLNRVVVASCSPRMHEPTFRKVVEEAGMNRYCFEQVNLREHVSWCHMMEPEAATAKAEDLLRMAVARAALLEPLEIKTVKVEQQALVVGGGLAGLRAALDIGSRGFNVTLVERQEELGGHLTKLDTLYPRDIKASDVVDKLLLALVPLKNVNVLKNSEVVEFSGHIGNFDVKIKNNGNGKKTKLKVGAVILTTGFEPFVPHGYYGYGESPNIMTLAELEEGKKFWGVPRLNNGRQPKSVMFIGCVGSREEGNKGHEHCSRYCCTAMAMNASKMKNIADEVLVLYDDIRTFGKGHEEFHRAARSKHVIFSKFQHNDRPSVRVDEDIITVRWYDVLSGVTCEYSPEMLVLIPAMVPPHDIDKTAKMFNLTRSGDGFFNEEHIKLAPLTTHTAGIMIAGAAHSPKDTSDSATQASGAAAKAVSLMARGEVEIESTVAHVREELCSACHTCVAACPYGAVSIDASRSPAVAFVTEAKCRGCGTCVAGCASNAMTMRHSTDEQILSMVTALLGPAPIYGGGE